MAPDIHQVVTLLVFFLSVALSMWRLPHGDRWHFALCVIAAVLWCGLPLFEPRTRTFGYGLIASNFLIIALSRPFQRRSDVRR